MPADFKFQQRVLSLSRALTIHEDGLSDSTSSLRSDMSDENVFTTNEGKNVKFTIRGQVLDRNGKGIHRRPPKGHRRNVGNLAFGINTDRSPNIVGLTQSQIDDGTLSALGDHTDRSMLGQSRQTLRLGLNTPALN